MNTHKLTDILLFIYLHCSLMVVHRSRQPVPADDHHPSHWSTMGICLAVGGVCQNVGLRS